MDREFDAQAEWNALARHLRETGQMTSLPATGFGMPTLPPARVPRPGDPGLPPQGMTVARPEPTHYEQYVDRYRHGISPGEAANELGLAAAPLALGPLGRLATASPKATGAAMGALGLGTATEAGEPAPSRSAAPRSSFSSSCFALRYAALVL